MFCFSVAFAVLFAAAGCGGGTGGTSGPGESSPESAQSSPTSVSAEEELYDVLPSFKYTLKNLGDTTLPIGAWVAPPYIDTVINTSITENYITPASYKDVADSGINAIYALYDKVDSSGKSDTGNNAAILKALDYAADNGIVYVLRDGNIMSFVEESHKTASAFYQSVYGHKGFGGVLAQDEPSALLFSALGEAKSNFVSEFGDDSAFMINLFPTYATQAQLFGDSSSAYTYRDYIEQYVQKVLPQYVSYDYYAMTGGNPNIASGVFENLSVVKEVCDEYGLPYWVFIQSCSFGNNRAVNQAEIDWQVNTSLAYGAKGIQYFTYWTPYDDAGTSPDFYPSRSNEQIMAMVAPDGSKNATYYYVQKTNRQAAAAGEYLVDCGMAGVIQVNGSPATVPEGDKLDSFRQLVGYEAEGDALIGCFDYFGKTLLYVVNNSIVNELEITLRLDKENEITTIREGAKGELIAKDVALSLGAGEAELLLLNIY